MQILREALCLSVPGEAYGDVCKEEGALEKENIEEEMISIPNIKSIW